MRIRVKQIVYGLISSNEPLPRFTRWLLHKSQADANAAFKKEVILGNDVALKSHLSCGLLITRETLTAGLAHTIGRNAATVTRVILEHISTQYKALSTMWDTSSWGKRSQVVALIYFGACLLQQCHEGLGPFEVVALELYGRDEEGPGFLFQCSCCKLVYCIYRGTN